MVVLSFYNLYDKPFETDVNIFYSSFLKIILSIQKKIAPPIRLAIIVALPMP